MATPMHLASDGYMVIGPSDDCNDRSCADCVTQFMGGAMWDMNRKGFRDIIAGHTIPVEEAKSEARKLAEQAQQDQKYIRNQLMTYGDVILTRWRKRSKQKREALILEARPHIYRQKCVNQHTASRFKQIQSSGTVLTPSSAEEFTNQSIRGALLMPYLNLESLLHDSSRLLGLLHHRSAHALEEWAPFDTQQMQYGFETAALIPKYNDSCLILHGTRYGDLVPYNPEDAHYWNTVGYTRGVLVLEAQSILYGFLRRCTDLLAAGAAATGDSAWRALTSAGMSSTGQVESWSPYINAPFSAPPKLNPEEYLCKTRALLVAADDHVRFLQTDPAYFQNILAKQRRGEVLSKVPSETFWEFMQAEVMVTAVKHVRQLQDVVGELQNVLQVYNRFRDQIQQGSRLPKKFDRAMGAIEFLCINYYQAEREQLEAILRTSPGFAEHYDTVPTQDGKIGTRMKRSKGYASCYEAHFKEDPLFWALWRLCQNPENGIEENPQFLLGIIDEVLAASSSKERARIDQGLYDHIARMSCYYELVTAVRLHRPCPRGFSQHSLTPDEKSRRGWRSWNVVSGNATAKETEDLSHLLKEFNDAQWPKGVHDQAWLRAATETRRRLSAFWTRARQVRRREISEIGWSKEDIEESIALFSADQTEEYQAELKAEQEEVARFVASQQAKVEQLQQQSSAAPQTVWGGDTQHSKLTLPLGRVKPKSRPHKSADEPSIAVHDKSDQEPGLSKILVKHESLRLFARMFPSSKTEAKGITKWAQFVTAMTDAGFSAVHIGGSAVHFGSDEGSIVFHKPHPEPNLDPVMLQNIGRRMEKWFRWGWERFAERQKTA